MFFFPVMLVLASMMLSYPTFGQDMLHGVDLEQPAYSQAEITRADIEKAIIDHSTGVRWIFQGKVSTV